MPAIPEPDARPGDAVTVERLGVKGDGEVRIDGDWVPVPGALPGEQVRIAVEGPRARLLEIVTPSPDRATPPCPHFGVCGGCRLQHMAEGACRTFKRSLVVNALKAQGLEPEVEETWVSSPGSRRRIPLVARRSQTGVRLGYHSRSSHDIVDIATCPVASPDITRKISALKELAGPLAPLKGEMEMLVTALPNGLDLHLSGVATFAAPHDLKMAAAKAQAAGFIRVSVGPDVILDIAEPEVQLGRAFLRPPPGSFVQPGPEAETYMASLVRQHLKFALEVADLFSGCGTFALRLAEESRVHAAEGRAEAVAALKESAETARGLKPVTAEVRDLFRNPVPSAALARFQGLVLNPPRAGAARQVEEIARSGVRRIAYIARDPGTLARDLSILTKGGYRIVFVQPVDQLLWSARIDTVALLEFGSMA